MPIMRTRLPSCCRMPDFIARHMCYPIWLTMQNMIVKEPFNVLLLHSVSISFHILYDIVFNVQDTNDNVGNEHAQCTHAAFNKVL